MDRKKLLIIFVAGMMFGIIMVEGIQSYYNDIDKQFDTVISMMYLDNVSVSILGRMNENTTIRQIQRYHERFPAQSEFLIKAQIKLLCGT